MSGPLPPTTEQAAAMAAFFLPRSELDRLLLALRAGGRRVIAPTVGDGAIVLAEVESIAELPAGVSAAVSPGRARLVPMGSERLFDAPPGPTSWKRWTFPPRVTQLEWTDAADEADGELAGARLPRTPAPAPPPTAFLGVRACEITALAVQDRVLRDGPVADADYAARRRDNLVVAVECAVAGGTCFCSSMGTGPELTGGFDLALSELDDGVVVRTGSDAGRALVADLGLADASTAQAAAAAASVARVRAAMGTPLPLAGIAAALVAAPDSPRWAQVAERCLACANCTLVCPTCFCTSVGQR